MRLRTWRLGCVWLTSIRRMLVGEILALTGQTHDDDFEYDKTIIIYFGSKSYLDVLKHTSDDILCVTPIAAAVLGLNLEEKRVVDVAVHPYFRRLGFGKAIVELAVKEYDVELAYTVEPEAEKFWKAIGWCYSGSMLDKGALVKTWRRLR